MLDFIHSLFLWLFPQSCICCHSAIDSGVLCPTCFGRVTFLEKPYCYKCGKLFTNGVSHGTLCSQCNKNAHSFDQARALFLYNDFIKRLIVNIKKTGNRNIICKCCELIVLRYNRFFHNISAIVPVPSHWSRTIIRGFNPADVIGWELSKLIDVPINRHLKRTRATSYQHKKTQAERLLNVRDAFEWNGENIGNVLIVDDVLTTGATLDECSRILRRSGAKKINCLTIASTKAY